MSFIKFSSFASFKMSRSQDIFGLLRGIQLVAGASVKTQEVYLKHLWSHSSVREAIEKSSSGSSDCGKKVITNPGEELQRVGKILQETFARSSVVFEGIRQYSSNGKSSINSINNAEVLNDSKSFSSSIRNLDIASITLKELENLLAEHNKMRDVVVKPKEVKKVENQKTEEVKFKRVQEVEKQETPLKPRVEPLPSVAKDEAQVQSVMKFITNYDRTVESTSVPGKSIVPEVSKNFQILVFDLPQSSSLLTCANGEKVDNFHKTQNACAHEKSKNSTDGDLKI